MQIRPKYCARCGNTGVDLQGRPCACRTQSILNGEAVSCAEIPKQYRGSLFNSMLVPKTCGEDYPKYLQSVYDKVAYLKWESHNTLIASPIQTSKTVLAYSCIEMLYRAGLQVCSVYDVYELFRAMLDFDMGKKAVNDITEPQLITTVPILFAKIPRVSRPDVFDAIALLVDRRVRRGNSTILLYDGSWSQCIRNDRDGILTGMMGDGRHSSIEVKSFQSIANHEIKLQENIGAVLTT